MSNVGIWICTDVFLGTCHGFQGMPISQNIWQNALSKDRTTRCRHDRRSLGGQAVSDWDKGVVSVQIRFSYLGGSCFGWLGSLLVLKHTHMSLQWEDLLDITGKGANKSRWFFPAFFGDAISGEHSSQTLSCSKITPLQKDQQATRGISFMFGGCGDCRTAPNNVSFIILRLNKGQGLWNSAGNAAPENQKGRPQQIFRVILNLVMREFFASLHTDYVWFRNPTPRSR